jgi:hypothetical protein
MPTIVRRCHSAFSLVCLDQSAAGQPFIERAASSEIPDRRCRWQHVDNSDIETVADFKTGLQGVRCIIISTSRLLELGASITDGLKRRSLLLMITLWAWQHHAAIGGAVGSVIDDLGA